MQRPPSKETAQRRKWVTQIASVSNPVFAVFFLTAFVFPFHGRSSDSGSACVRVSECTGVVAGPNVFVRLDGGRLQTSVDATHWTNYCAWLRTFFRDVTYANDLFVAVGGSYFDESGVIVTSPDGMVWTRRASGTAKNLYSIAFGNGTFIAVGDSGAVCTAKNGLHWKAQRSGTSTLLSAVAAGNGIYLAGGESGTILISTDAVNWNVGNVGAFVYVNRIVFRNSRFVLHGGGRTFSSHDGLKWQ